MEFPITANLCYIINEKGEVLLQKKALGWGKGNWNGPGGKVDPGESMEESVKREILEETNVKIKSLEERGFLEFIFSKERSKNNQRVYLFISRDYEGEPKNMGEGELKWFSKDKIPLKEMWDDDKYWLLPMLLGRTVKMRFYFDDNNKVIKCDNLDS